MGALCKGEKMTQLDKDIKHLEKNLETWLGFYNRVDLARANRMLSYMWELRKLKGGEK